MSLLVQPGLVTTIIPVYNRPQFIIDAVNSVLQQSYRPIEILIVDDGSTDETFEVIQSLADKYQEIQIFTQKNSGPGPARELGRLNARGEYIQYLDSDDLLLPNKFIDQVAKLRGNPDADVCYGKTEAILLGESPKGQASRGTGSVFLSMFPTFLRERWWFTSTPLYRRSVIEEAGPWTSEINEEDWEYDCRVAALGGRLVFVDSFVSLQRSHDSHLCEGGNTVPEKLASRAISRAKIFQHAKTYSLLKNTRAKILEEDWRFFSDYAFLLARQCASAGLTTEARAMLSISIEAIENKTWQHKVFIKLVKMFGWVKASKLVAKIKG